MLKHKKISIHQALNISEALWNDITTENGLFDSMIKDAPRLEKLKMMGKAEEVDKEIQSARNEIIARWANIISEMGNHGEAKAQSKE